NGVAFSPDGRRLASAGSDRTVKVWNSATGQQITLRGHTAAVLCVVFSPGGHVLASADASGVVQVWDGTPATLPSPYSRMAPKTAPLLNPVEEALPKSPADREPKEGPTEPGLPEKKREAPDDRDTSGKV